jgi:hypothetical protein
VIFQLPKPFSQAQNMWDHAAVSWPAMAIYI